MTSSEHALTRPIVRPQPPRAAARMQRKADLNQGLKQRTPCVGPLVFLRLGLLLRQVQQDGHGTPGLEHFFQLTAKTKHSVGVGNASCCCYCCCGLRCCYCCCCRLPLEGACLFRRPCEQKQWCTVCAAKRALYAVCLCRRDSYVLQPCFTGSLLSLVLLKRIKSVVGNGASRLD